MWFYVARAAQWKSLEDVRKDFPSVDRVGAYLIFNVRHNRYRLIVKHVFPNPRLYVKAFLSHKEYDRYEFD
ncbi:MAG: type II toxin-antitoxin system HigB family toxin [Bryobacterales bacterium]|nr:type II toxin-antitoxin system HigB family toxin [Bryobacterales bacterium]MBV9396857.1 type II toxin-antitoxin system HigB family toxin [Bryobacterales bacterium]